MLSILVIVIGIAVLMFGKRLPVLGAAVGALLGVGLLRLFPGSSNSLLALLIPGLLAVIGFLVTGFAKGIVNLVVLALGALAGAAVVIAVLDLFSITSGSLDWLFAIVGGVVGLVMVSRFKDWAMIVLAGLIGGLLVERGLQVWLPFLEGIWGTLLVAALAGVSIAFQGGFLGKRKDAA